MEPPTGSATLANFSYVGNVTMPVAGGQPVQMMEFTADSITLAGGVTDSVTQVSPAGTATTVTSTPTMTFSGSVTLYATQLSGSVAGITPTITFTPSTVSAVLLQIANALGSILPSITLTNVTTDQPLVTAGSLQTGGLSLGFGG
jgi:hypothetical protein